MLMFRLEASATIYTMYRITLLLMKAKDEMMCLLVLFLLLLDFGATTCTFKQCLQICSTALIFCKAMPSSVVLEI